MNFCIGAGLWHYVGHQPRPDGKIEVQIEVDLYWQNQSSQDVRIMELPAHFRTGPLAQTDATVRLAGEVVIKPEECKVAYQQRAAVLVFQPPPGFQEQPTGGNLEKWHLWIREDRQVERTD